MTINILFLCRHAAAKSVAARALFDDAASRFGLDVDTGNAGTEPDDAIDPVVEARLAQGQAHRPEQPRAVTEHDLAQADIIINIGCDIERLPVDGSDLPKKVVDWVLPDFSDDPDAAFDAVKLKATELASSLAGRLRPIVLVGVGQMGGVFAKAFLAAGHTVVPATRSDDLNLVAALTPEPALVLITVGEDDLDTVLSTLPASWKSSVGLIQNELLPRDWERHGIVDPTVAVVWFEKKRGTDTKVIVSSPVSGPAANLIVSALEHDQITAHEVSTTEIVDALIVKNLYILVANIAGLETGGTVSELWQNHRELARAVGDEVLAIQEHLVGRTIDADVSYAGMVDAFEGDPNHGTTGRSAPRRLERALRNAENAGIEVPNLAAIARAHALSA